jgi:NSS family neurotransmitter:Na+ symporter
MDQTGKWTLYLIALVAGFTTGIGTIGLFPQMWLEYGMTGLILHLVFLAILAYVAIIEAEKVMKSGYHFAELYGKVTRRPAMILTILVVVLMFLSYYTANTMLVFLAPVIGTGTVGRLIAALTMLAIVYVILTRAKEKTFLIMAFGALFFILAITITAIAFKLTIPSTAVFLATAKHMATSSHGISLEMLKDTASRAVYGIGLGFAFYLMLGSFMNERFNSKLIIGTGVLIQVIIGFLSAVIVIYGLAPTSPDRLIKYVYGGNEGAINVMKDLPTILSSHPLLVALLGISIFMAGLTSILPTAEIGLQIMESSFRVGRNKAALYLTGVVAVLAIVDAPPSAAEMALNAVSAALFFTAIFELYPVLTLKKGASSFETSFALVMAAIFAGGGLYAIIDLFGKGGIYIGSAILAVLVVLFGFFGDSLIPKGEEAS